MLEGTTETTAEPTLEDIVNGMEQEQATPEEAKPQPQEASGGATEAAEQKLAYLRKLRAAEKRIKELEGAKKSPEDSKPRIDIDSPNPLREIAKHRKLSQDDIVRMAMEIMDGEVVEEGKKPMTPEEIIAEAKRQLKAELEEETKTVKEKEEVKKKSEESNKIINDFVTNNAEKYPLIGGLGGTDQVYAEIEKDFLTKSEEFGEEFARENLMTLDQAAKKVNDELAKSVKTALESKHLRNFIKSLLKDEPANDETLNLLDDDYQLEESPTLNNSEFKPVAQSKRFDPTDEDENWKAALALLD